MRTHIPAYGTSIKEGKEAFLLSSNHIGNAMKGNRSTAAVINQFSLSQCVESWTGKQISKWIEGLGDQMNPYLGILRNNIISGKELEILDDEILIKMGVSGVGPRKIILQAVQLLRHFCYESKNENLQRLAMNAKLAARSIQKQMINALFMREKAIRRAEIVTILNNVTGAVSNAAECTKKLIFWLDRSPFDDIPSFMEKRNRIVHLIWNLVRNVSVQPKALFQNSTEIVKIASELEEECQAMVDSDDPMTLYTAYMEPALLKRADQDVNWGLNLQSSFKGVHVISEIKVSSPADMCTKIDAGDEIVMINGKIVIGWDLTSVAQRIAGSGTELNLMLNKRPKEAAHFLMNKDGRPTSRPFAAPGSQATDSEGRNSFSSVGFPLTRRRSLTMLSEIVKLSDLRIRTERRSRRASIGSDNPIREIRSNSGRIDGQTEFVDITGCDAVEEALVPRIVRRARTMRHQPDGYVRSFIDNKLVHEIEDDVVADQLPFNMKCPSEFAEITIVEPNELQQLNLVEPKPSDYEWRAPFQELSTQYRAPLTDSAMSGSVESPRFISRRMTSSMDESTAAVFGVLPSPSTSSINSLSSPAAYRNTFTPNTDWGPSGDDQPGSPSTKPQKTAEKVYEGWVRRRKTKAELSSNEVTNKWPKCWMSLNGCYLSLYPNQFARRADITINVTKANILESTDLKTSKKNVFRVTSSTIDYHFSCYNSLDLKCWIQKLKTAKEVFSSGQQRVMSQSVSYYNEAELAGTDSHYNTMSGGLPSMMSQSHSDGTRSAREASGAGASLSSLTRGATESHHKQTGYHKSRKH